MNSFKPPPYETVKLQFLNAFCIATKENVSYRNPGRF